MALFITFEGGEGSGKSTQAKLLYRRLAKLGLAVVLTREPGGTPAGDRIARILKWGGQDLEPLTELLLFNASRAELVNRVIKPALAERKIVLCDRFADSTAAYQGYGRGLDLDTVNQVNNVATSGVKPHLTFLLDVPVEAGLARKNRRPDRFEKEEVDFHERVRRGYLELAQSGPGRWVVLDGMQHQDAIFRTVWEKTVQLLASKFCHSEGA